MVFYDQQPTWSNDPRVIPTDVMNQHDIVNESQVLKLLLFKNNFFIFYLLNK